jgi:hypothetical protein
MEKSHNEKLNNFYFSQNIIMVIKSSMSWVEYVARKEIRNGYKMLETSREEENYMNRMIWTGFMQLRTVSWLL